MRLNLELFKDLDDSRKKDIMHCWITLAEYEKKAVNRNVFYHLFPIIVYLKKNTALNVTSVLKLHPKKKN